MTLSISAAFFFKKLYALFCYLVSGIFINVLLRFIKKCEWIFQKYIYNMHSDLDFFIDQTVDFDVFGDRGGKIALWLVIIFIPQWVYLFWFNYIHVDFFESFDEAFFDDFVGEKSYTSGLSGTAHFEEWDFFDNSISVEDLDYEEDPTDYEELFSFVNDEEYDGEELYDNGLDMPPDIPYFNNHYNGGEIVDSIDWRPQSHPLGHFQNRRYFVDTDYLNPFFGISSIGSYGDPLEFPSSVESYIIKYKWFADEYDPEYRNVPPINYFYRDIPSDEMFWEYFFEDPYSELDLYEEELMGEADFEELFEMYSEDYIEEDWEDEDEDDELFDFYPDYENVAEEDDRYEFLYPKKFIWEGIDVPEYGAEQVMAGDMVFFYPSHEWSNPDDEEEEWDINRPTIWDQIVPYAFPELEDIDYPDQDLFNTYDDDSVEGGARFEGDNTFYRVFPNVDNHAYGYDDYDDDFDLTEMTMWDLTEIWVGSLYYKCFSDIDPSWFWTYANIGSNIEAMRDILFDKFVVSSSNPEEDNILASYYGYFWGLSEARLVKELLLGELEQRVYDVKQLYFSLSDIKEHIKPFYPVRFSVVHFIYECFNYSSLKWITVQDALLYSKLEYAIAENELAFFLAGTLPTKLARKINISPLVFNSDLLHVNDVVLNNLYFLINTFQWVHNNIVGPFQTKFFGNIADYNSVAFSATFDLFGWGDNEPVDLHFEESFRMDEEVRYFDMIDTLDTDVNKYIPYWLRLGVTSYNFVMEEFYDTYDPRKKNILNPLYLLLKEKPKKSYPDGFIPTNEQLVSFYINRNIKKPGIVTFEEYVWLSFYPICTYPRKKREFVNDKLPLFLRFSYINEFSRFTVKYPIV